MQNSFEVIFKCSDYVIIFKPYGVLSEESASEENAPALIRSQLDKDAFPYESVYVVHRLDRTTEGLMLYALNSGFAAEISKSITSGYFKKNYSAIVSYPDDFPTEGEMTDYLFFDRRAAKSYIVDKNKKGAKEAILKYNIESIGTYKEKKIAVAKVELITGRTHQIRAQFSSRKAPLMGDGKYGSKINHKAASLRSVYIEFPYKNTVRSYSISSLELPE